MKRSALAVALMSACTLSLSPITVSAQGTEAEPGSQTPGISSGGGSSYETLDLNKDGWISNDEAQSEPALSSQYADIDLDGNGYLSPSEFAAFEQQELEAPMVPPYGATMTFEELDTNKDGRLVREEAIHEPKLDQQYSSIDQDRDAYISRSEFSAFEMREKGGKPAAPGAEDAMPMSFEELDTNRDGAITSAELDARPQVSGKTAAMDTNMDGKITRQEYEAVMAMQPPSRDLSLASMDVNDDGVVDKREANVDPTLQEHFDSFDVDRNSQIDQSEFSVFESLYENIREGITE